MTSLCVAEDEREEVLCWLHSEGERVSQQTEGSSSQVANTGWEYGDALEKNKPQWSAQERISHGSRRDAAGRSESGWRRRTGRGVGAHWGPRARCELCARRLVRVKRGATGGAREGGSGDE